MAFNFIKDIKTPGDIAGFIAGFSKQIGVDPKVFKALYNLLAHVYLVFSAGKFKNFLKYLGKFLRPFIALKNLLLKWFKKQKINKGFDTVKKLLLKINIKHIALFCSSALTYFQKFSGIGTIIGKLSKLVINLSNRLFKAEAMFLKQYNQAKQNESLMEGIFTGILKAIQISLRPILGPALWLLEKLIKYIISPLSKFVNKIKEYLEKTGILSLQKAFVSFSVAAFIFGSFSVSALFLTVAGAIFTVNVFLSQLASIKTKATIAKFGTAIVMGRTDKVMGYIDEIVGSMFGNLEQAIDSL